VFDIEAVRQSTPIHLKGLGLGGWNRSPWKRIDAVESNGISNGYFHNELIGKPIQLLPPALLQPASNILGDPPQSMSIDRSTTVGLEEGSVSANEANRIDLK